MFPRNYTLAQALAQSRQGRPPQPPVAPTPFGTAPDGTPIQSANTPGYAFDYLTKKRELHPFAAAGLVDNLEYESGFAPDVLNGQKRGDNGTAGYGFQWRGKRLRNFENYAAQRGHAPGTLPHFDAQLDFALEEMNPNSPYADSIAAANRNAILNPASRRDGAIAFATHFERPAPQHIPGRPGAARIPGVDGVSPSEAMPLRPDQPVEPIEPSGLLGMADVESDGLKKLLGEKDDKAKKKTPGQVLADGLAKAAEGFGSVRAPRSNRPPPRNSFVSAQAMPWVKPIGFG